jgi:hypothetical protein
MKKSTFLTILLALSSGLMMFSNSKAEELTPEEKAKYMEVNRAVRKASPDFDVQKKAIVAAYREAVLKIDSTLADIVDLKMDTLTPEQQTKLSKARKDAEKADPTLKERANANSSAFKAAIVKADPTMEPLLAKMARKPGNSAASPTPAPATPTPSAAPAASSGN